MEVTLIDTATIKTMKPVWGCLAGWGEEGGVWAIELMTVDDWFRFESTHEKSAFAVAKVKQILRGDNGLQNPNGYIQIVDGYLEFLDARHVFTD